jgi:Phosphoinositide phospholipase C, Ca2+-dependent
MHLSRFSFALAALLLSGSRPVADLPINHYQWIGSHNSYKEYIDPELIQVMAKMDTTRGYRGLEYHHMGLSEQLNLGLRALEIDFYADEKGGKYAQPKGLSMSGAKPTRPFDPDGVMREPGFKVLHVQDIDFRSNCMTLAICLRELRQWSEAHPDHEPLFLTFNAKDDTIRRPGFTPPEKFTAAVLDQLDQVLIKELGREKIFTPNDLRGKNTSLEAAVLTKGWPSLRRMRGKFVLVLDEGAAKNAAYIKGHPALAGRAMFINAPTGTPESAILIMNDPIKQGAQIRENVKKGYIVRTRADADTREARTNDYTRFKAAMASGAQIISTDYYVKTTLFPSDFVVSFEGKKYFRGNLAF